MRRRAADTLASLALICPPDVPPPALDLPDCRGAFPDPTLTCTVDRARCRSSSIAARSCGSASAVLHGENACRNCAFAAGCSGTVDSRCEGPNASKDEVRERGGSPGAAGRAERARSVDRPLLEAALGGEPRPGALVRPMDAEGEGVAALTGWRMARRPKPPPVEARAEGVWTRGRS